MGIFGKSKAAAEPAAQELSSTGKQPYGMSSANCVMDCHTSCTALCYHDVTGCLFHRGAPTAGMTVLQGWLQSAVTVVCC
jgi:hypothetical protein